VARCSIQNEALLYKLFGINAELLIDHAWGWEPCTLSDIKSYRPGTRSLSTGQVLQCPYPSEKSRLIVREMADLLALDLVDKELVTDQIVLCIGYDRENLSDPVRRHAYTGAVVTDHYGRAIPKHAHGTANLGRRTASTKLIVDAVLDLFDRIADPELLVRRVNLSANHVLPATAANPGFEQLDLFTSPAELAQQSAELEREHRRQLAELAIKKKYGKNAILKGMNLRDGATTRDRNSQIGGHKA
jgi:DNA polymerase V